MLPREGGPAPPFRTGEGMLEAGRSPPPLPPILADTGAHRRAGLQDGTPIVTIEQDRRAALGWVPKSGLLPAAVCFRLYYDFGLELPTKMARPIDQWSVSRERRDREAEYAARSDRYAERRAKGRCVQCNVPSPGVSRCEPCSRTRRLRSRQHAIHTCRGT